jgi:Protein of unknown function (DUF4446)
VSLDPDVVQYLALGGAIAGGLGLLLGLASVVRLGRLRRTYTLLQGGKGQDSFVDVVARKIEQVEGLKADVAAVQQHLEVIASDVADAISHVAVVRYDAFSTMGGRLSFSVALLDDQGDGLVLSSINGRSETRTYAKGVKAGASEVSLSPEEEQVVGWAMRDVRPPRKSS